MKSGTEGILQNLYLSTEYCQSYRSIVTKLKMWYKNQEVYEILNP